MKLTAKNAHEYVGKTLHSNGKRRFYNYPLTVKMGHDGSHYFTDSMGVSMPAPDEKDDFNTVHFDYAE